MKARKVRLPKTGRDWVFLGLFVLVVILGSWPVIPLFSQNVVVLGMPLMMLWSYVIVFLTCFLMWLSTRMGAK